jgi:probable rRNA maturation factor
VELNLQDYFFADSGDRDEGVHNQPADRPNAPVPPEQWEIWVQGWLAQLQTDLPPRSTYELSLRLTDDAEIQTFNAQYRQKDQPTDVLAFAALEVTAPQPEDLIADLPLYLGDMIISVETAQRQATQLGHSLEQELAWLAAHALLHLLGWDHPDEASLTRMLKQQQFLLHTVGLSIDSYQIDSYQIEKSAEQEYPDTEPCKV